MQKVFFFCLALLVFASGISAQIITRDLQVVHPSFIPGPLNETHFNYLREKVRPDVDIAAGAWYDRRLNFSQAFSGSSDWVFSTGVVSGLVPSERSALHVFPNPSSGEISWQGERRDGQILRYDLREKLLWNFYLASAKAGLSLLPPGTYLLHLQTDQQSH